MGSNNTPHALTQTQIDECWKEWLGIIIHAANTCIGTSNPPPNSKEWWHFAPDIQTLHETHRKARNDMRAARRRGRVVPENDVLESTRKTYLKAKGALRSAINKGQQGYWDELTAAIDETTPNNRHKPYWARLKRVMPSTLKPMTSCVDRNGAPPLTPQHALNNLAEHLAHISSLAHDPSYDVQHEHHVKEYLTNIPPHSNVRESPPFSLDDVSQYCLKFRQHCSW